MHKQILKTMLLNVLCCTVFIKCFIISVLRFMLLKARIKARIQIGFLSNRRVTLFQNERHRHTKNVI